MPVSLVRHIPLKVAQALHVSSGGGGHVLVVQPPGWGTGSGPYEQIFGPLERELTVVYYDTRGSGRSESPARPARGERRTC